jgi:hypothetical protein
VQSGLEETESWRSREPVVSRSFEPDFVQIGDSNTILLTKRVRSRRRRCKKCMRTYLLPRRPLRIVLKVAQPVIEH